jgi:protein SCO1/2
MNRRRRLILPVTMSLLALAALVFAIVATRESRGGGSAATSSTPPATQSAPAQAPAAQGGFEGAEIPGAPPAPPIALSDQYGRAASLSALRGQPVVLGFLYTRCGGPCEVIAQQIRGALDELHRPVPVLLVSVDPAGDTPPAVRHFLAKVSLSGRVYYLTGSPAVLAGVWRDYKVRPPSAGAAAFARHANVLLIDGAGRERVVFGTEQLTPEALAHDIGKLQAG